MAKQVIEAPQTPMRVLKAQ